MTDISSQTAADEFFARYTNPTPETIERLRQEIHPDGDITVFITAGFRYSNRVEDEKARHVREVLDYTDPFTERDETARRPYASPDALAALPAPAYAKQPLAQRYANDIRARVFWNHISKPENRDRIAAKARAAAEVTKVMRARVAQAAARRDATARREAALAARRQQHLQRTLDRIGRIHANRAAADLRRRSQRLRTEIHPAGVTLDRAFEIAMAITPPQAPR